MDSRMTDYTKRCLFDIIVNIILFFALYYISYYALSKGGDDANKSIAFMISYIMLRITQLDNGKENKR